MSAIKTKPRKLGHLPNRGAKATNPAVDPIDKSRHLAVSHIPGKTEDRQFADLVTDGLVSNASTAIRFNKFEQGDVSLTDLVASLRDQGDAVNRGDLAASERMLSAQTVALNSIFIELARRAAVNMGQHLPAAETYMRLALKAQSQCRTTVEALAEMKNPRAVAFVKQANIANGPQQVNNGLVPNSTHPGARAGETQPEPSKLLEAHDVERLDTGAKGSTGRDDSKVATVGAGHRTAKHGR